MLETCSKFFTDNKKDIDFEPFADNSIYYKLQNSNVLSEDDKRFAELAREYYIALKEKTDKEIKKYLKGCRVALAS
jgi:hypothetical protein